MLPSLLAALALTLGAAAPPTPLAAKLDDPTIIAIFDAANTFDIETGLLAQERARDGEVRALASQFVADHRAVRQQGRDLARRLGVTPTPPAELELARAHAQALRTLGPKRGAEFDRAYLAHEIAFHQAVVDALNSTLLPAITNPELRALVERVIPAFQGHLEAAKALERRLAGHS